MKKIGFFLMIFSIIAILIVYLTQIKKENDIKEIMSNTSISEEDKSIIENKNISKKEIDEKIKSLKKKISLKGLIKKAKMYYDENEYMIALIEYQKILKNLPNDEEINSKIGDIYYKIHKYKKANEYYEKIKKSNFLNKDKAVFSLINDRGISKENILEINKKILEFNLSEEKKFYYTNSNLCIIDYSLCRDKFQKYFENNKDLKTEEMRIMFQAFENFKNFKLDNDLYYKASFVTGAFFQNGFYYISLKTAEGILKQKDDYKPILKIAAKSSYEIGDYLLAKTYLNKLRKMEQDDPEVNYFLARVYEKLNDKVPALINYQKALKDGYKDKIDIKRRIIFLYFESGETEKMLKEFDELLKINSDEINENDYILAIYYNIINSRREKAKLYTEKAIEKFKNSGVFRGYQSWIMLQKDELSNIELKIIKANIEKAKKENKSNPMIIMLEGIYEAKTKNYDKAIINLKSAYSADKSGEYKEIINLWLEQINLEKNLENSN